MNLDKSYRFNLTVHVLIVIRTSQYYTNIRECYVADTAGYQ